MSADDLAKIRDYIEGTEGLSFHSLVGLPPAPTNTTASIDTVPPSEVSTRDGNN